MKTDLSTLNDQQKKAVLESYDQNTSLIAGAGSGKTTVIKFRTAYMIQDLQIPPSQIMIVTFTNKAATEIKERIFSITNQADEMWLGTFHSICVKILRQFGTYLGIDNFTILDEDDVRQRLKHLLKEQNIKLDSDVFKTLRKKISFFKSELILPSNLKNRMDLSNDEIQITKVYELYHQQNLKKRTLDFDDLILYTVFLLTQYKNVRDWFHEHIKYICIDEFQDTNKAQFELIRLLVGKNNLFMVGDDDQSIYAFRNAKPEYLINLENFFEGTKTLKLEQNYRSNQTIIQASNAVIKHNQIRNDKTMFTAHTGRTPIVYKKCENPEEEAEWLVNVIKFHFAIGFDYEEIAVLFRKNSQSRVIEQELLKAHIPYSTIGVSFYDRAVIKDLLSFFKFKENQKDDASFKRIFKQLVGIGDKTVQDLLKYANNHKKSLVKTLEEFHFRSAQQKMVTELITWLKDEKYSLIESLDFILKLTMKQERLKQRETEESQDELDLISEFYHLVRLFETQEQHSLNDFLTMVSLQTDRKNAKSGVSLMTIHSAKGLEYNTVFLVGLEETILPSERSSKSQQGLEEERRLMYVAMTRAQENLYLSYCRERTEYGVTVYSNYPSRFLDEIPKTCLLEV